MADEHQSEQPGAEKKPAETTSQPTSLSPPAEAGSEKPAPPPKPAAAAKKPAAKKVVVKKPAVMETSPWDDELAQAVRQSFPDQVLECSTYLGQKFLVARADSLVAVLEYLRLEADFDYLVDLTAVDYPKKEERFEVVYVLYSFSRNERVRVKIPIKDGESVESAVSVYLTANWLEREVYDMFGIEFSNHPDLKRILLPEDWEGFPLRKDKDILDMDQQWVKDNIGIDSGQ